MMVSGSLWGSVVASTRTACPGGSSRVFRSALNAGSVSMWTSSMMYTLYGGLVGSEVDALSERPYIVDAAVAGGVDLDEIEGAPLVDGEADPA